MEPAFVYAEMNWPTCQFHEELVPWYRLPAKERRLTVVLQIGLFISLDRIISSLTENICTKTGETVCFLDQCTVPHAIRRL
jgi:hypothetical protein